MSTENWIVKKQNGEEWGLIKRLIIESATKQISSADVIVMDTGRLVRVSWDSLLVETGGIIITNCDGHLDSRSLTTHGARPSGTVAMEVWS